MDPLDVWWGNQEVVENLTSFLSAREVGALCCVSTRWREVLNFDHLWYKLCIRAGCHTEYDNLGVEREGWLDGEGSLQSLCEWGLHYRLCQGVRKRWREGGEVVRVLQVPGRGKTNEEVTCYDCEGDILCIGTVSGCFLCWNITAGTSWAVECVLGTKVDKLYVRHRKVVLMQGGLIQVYDAQDKPHLMFCKTLDSPNKKKLYGAGVSYDDEHYVPLLPRDQLRARYKPECRVSLQQLDITVSTKGRQRLGMSLTGSTHATVYQLDTGEREQKVSLETGDTLLKLGIVQFREFSDYLYIVLYDISGNICGTMYHLDSKHFLWRLELHTVFNYDYSVFSLFTSHGLLLFGRKPDDSYPFTWLWRGWTYLGTQFYSHDYETEYDMYLADCSDNAVVTPRAMTYLFPGSRVLAFSQRTHRGLSTMAYSWGQQTHKLWNTTKVSSVKSDASVPVCGADVGSVVLTCQGQHSILVRDMLSGTKLREISVEGSIGNMWADQGKIITIDDKDLSKKGSVTVISMAL